MALLAGKRVDRNLPLPHFSMNLHHTYPVFYAQPSIQVIQSLSNDCEEGISDYSAYINIMNGIIFINQQ
jgi:hypothetical protein